MRRFHINQFELEGGDQPKHSPIRRKSKLRQAKGVQPKPRGSHERELHRIKVKLQNAYILDCLDDNIYIDI